MWHNIPAELRQLPQWVVAGDDKVPRHARTGQLASSTDPATWVTFEEACRAGYKHIGFVLAEADPYAIIDLDNKVDDPVTPEQWELHKKILETFESYTERSASGRGYHIVIRGKLPAGVHSRDKVEVYSSGRYMVFTGDIIRQAPIGDYQALLDQLYGEMKPAEAIELVDREGPLDDDALVDMASRAENGNKFDSLCNGQWQEMGYPSQSEADYALLAILAFYTPDNEQVRRLFRYSKLGQREKAQKNNVYLNRCLEKIRAVQNPVQVDISSLQAQASALLARQPKDPPLTDVPPAERPRYGDAPALAEKVDNLSVPPGLVGDIAKYFYSSSVRPVPEISLAASLGIMAGVAGRCYNISGSGLNLYIILLAKTGRGKEGAASGIDRLISATRAQVPMIDEFIGPAAFASGQALLKVLNDRPCFVSVLGEFGLTLQQVCDPRASSAEVMLRKVLLDLYTKSGWQSTLRAMHYSDKEKNTKDVQAPAVTVLGESTQERFFDGLDSSHISEGLIPRFCCIEYTGKRPPHNDHAGQPPTHELVARFAEVVVKSLACAQNNTCMPVAVDTNSDTMLKQFNKECDDRINTTESTVENELWNRAHLKTLRLSALLAVGVNPHQPVVTPDLVQWSIDFVKRDIGAVATRFRTGDVGVGDSKMIADVKRVITAYLSSHYNQVKAYDVEKAMFDDKVVPYVYLQRRTANLSAFKRDRRGGSGALRAVLEDMVKSGLIAELPRVQISAKYKSSATAYAVVKAWTD